jgi:hypothetical protein
MTLSSDLPRVRVPGLGIRIPRRWSGWIRSLSAAGPAPADRKLLIRVEPFYLLSSTKFQLNQDLFTVYVHIGVGANPITKKERFSKYIAIIFLNSGRVLNPCLEHAMVLKLGVNGLRNALHTKYHTKILIKIWEIENRQFCMWIACGVVARLYRKIQYKRFTGTYLDYRSD